MTGRKHSPFHFPLLRVVVTVEIDWDRAPFLLEAHEPVVPTRILAKVVASAAGLAGVGYRLPMDGVVGTVFQLGRVTAVECIHDRAVMG